MSRFLLCELLICLTFTTSVIFAQQSAPTTLRQAADSHLLIGTAIMSGATENPQRAALIAEQFNCLTGENEFKVDSLEHVQGKFTFEGADKIIAFAQQHDMKVVGHNLCWHQQSPAWMFADADKKPLPREQALANLKNHIDTVVKHFKGQVIGWDVVNEAMSDSPKEYLRDTPAHRAIGDDFIEKAFEFAHAADPDVALYYNDYNIEEPVKREKVIRLIRQLKAKNLRIDGVGIQGHWLINHTDPKTVDDAITAFTNEGMKVMITEMDIDVLPRKSGAEISATEKLGANPYKDGCPPEVLQQQADRYAAFFAVFMKHRDVVTRITFWGVDDGTSWLNGWPVKGRTNYPLLFDRQLNPKPAFFAVLKSIS